MKDYQVGQILFLIADASKVVPIQVIEEVIRTTLEGKEKTYIVKLPDKKETCFDIKKIKVGHAGTLDPLADGLLIVCTGKFTKRINEFQGQEKEYTAEFT